MIDVYLLECKYTHFGIIKGKKPDYFRVNKKGGFGLLFQFILNTSSFT